MLPLSFGAKYLCSFCLRVVKNGKVLLFCFWVLFLSIINGVHDLYFFAVKVK